MPNHVKEAVFCPSPDHANFALQGLVGVVDLLCAGRAPPSILPYLCDATLLSCRKKGGGLRPIAIGEVLRRLTSKCVSRAVQADAVGVLSPLQVAVGIPVGCESIVHPVASLQGDPNIQLESRCSLLVDLLSILWIVGVCSKKCGPEFPQWLHGLRAAMVPSHSYIYDDKLFSSCGVQQGGPLVPCALPSPSILLLSK